MTAPRAVGVRLPYAAVPATVRAWVEQTLGSPVDSVAEQVGGMSPGCGTRLACADDFRIRESRRMLEAVARRTGR